MISSERSYWRWRRSNSLACAALSILFGCGPGDAQHDAALKQQVAGLQSRLKSEDAEIRIQKTWIDLIQYQVTALSSDSAMLDTGTKSYAIARTQFGPFPVVVDQVTPYLDGYKIDFEVANLTNAEFSGASVTAQWGPSGFGQKKTVDVTNEFLPGRYTKLEMVVAPAKATDVKTVQIGLLFNQMRLGVALGQP